MIKKADWLAISRDRSVIVLLLFIGLTLIAVVISALFRIHANDVQIPGRYSVYGSANIYRNQWYLLYAFPLFSLLIGVLNSYLAIKIYSLNRMVGVGILGATLIIIMTCFVVANSIFNLAPSV